MTIEPSKYDQNISDFSEILALAQDEPILFDTDKRLLSKNWIADFKNECEFEMENIIPLIDCFDNDFLCFDKANNEFAMVNISEDLIWKRFDTFDDFYSLKDLKNKIINK